MKKFLLSLAAIFFAVSVNAQDETPLYTAVGQVAVDEAWESDYQTAHIVEGDLTIEGYEGYVVIKAFDGVEGYDLAVAFDEEENATDIVVRFEGEEIDATADWADSGNAYWYAYVGGGYSFAGSDPETKSGYVHLSAYVGNDYVYYYVTWGESDEDSFAPEVTIDGADPEATEVDEIAVVSINFGEYAVSVVEPSEENDYFVPAPYVEYENGDAVLGMLSVSKTGENILVWEAHEPAVMAGDVKFIIPAGCIKFEDGTLNETYEYAFTISGAKDNGQGGGELIELDKSFVTITPGEGKVTSLEQFSLTFIEPVMDAAPLNDFAEPKLIDAEGNQVPAVGMLNNRYTEDLSSCVGVDVVFEIEAPLAPGAYTLEVPVKVTNDWVEYAGATLVFNYTLVEGESELGEPIAKYDGKVNEGDEDAEMAVAVETYANNVVVIRNWCEYPGVDLYIEYDETGAVTYVTNIIDGVKQERNIIVDGYDLVYQQVNTGVFDVNLFFVNESTTSFGANYNKNKYLASKVEITETAGLISLFIQDADDEEWPYVATWTTTGIESVSAEAQATAVYNLAGQRVNANFKGIVVKAGKKIIQ